MARAVLVDHAVKVRIYPNAAQAGLLSKCKRAGNHLVKIDRFYPSSKLCSNCGYKHYPLTLADPEWTCRDCGTRHDRDAN